ncbi:hypothetical protein EDB81DRAFT_67951 [Dactylonectria macrodidyma]|uniref:Fungal N-terminal domain-containing protein n=1 Tax=Dactylonectria macrodidyma TaxID=307937 RepID=A0A9P9EPW0_9HYPO|nr:hypothetical protein EDB81DRAFT_67951 [Dactylonectria macrodidyma]
MSFGFSAGDFLAVGKQIKDISSHIRHASASYQALDVELHSLKRALDEIEHIRCPVGQEPAINKVKVTALNCRQLLTDFESKLKKYAILNQQHGAGLGKTRALQKLGRKVEWGIEMEEEAVKLRAAIVAHVGFLNLRLSSLGINASFFAAQKLDEHHEELNRKLGQVRGEVGESRREQAAQGSLIAATSSLILNQVSEIASACIGVRLDALLELAQNIWNSNVQIIALVSELHSRPPKLDTSHTWFQDPIRFEDAFGRVFPIPSEYGWSVSEPYDSWILC